MRRFLSGSAVLSVVLCLSDVGMAAGAGGCLTDADCEDGLFCTIDICDTASGFCAALSACPPMIIPDCMIINDSCDEENDRCVDTDLCDDGIFCNGIESCDLATETCVAVSACPPAINGCLVFGSSCDEENDECPGIPDDSLCPPGTSCRDDGQCVAAAVPTVSTWGLAVMLLLLLCGSKVYFSRRRVGRETV